MKSSLVFFEEISQEFCLLM